jgi:stearoyl-CoA desaturase (delta-9 desaturase)
MVGLAMFVAIGLSVTAGYHRLFSHRAYQASWPVRLVFLLFGAAAFQNSALKWSSDHRAHHHHVDDLDRDPYVIGKGFWYAHWTWVMEKKDLPLEGVADLEKDPLVRWQHRHHFLIGGLVALLPVWIGLATGNVLGHAVIGLLLRIVLTHHTTFLINSAAHVFGSRPYTEGNSARDNWLLAPFTFGEGYHNYHHMWQWDYRNGVRWFQWDPTKWLVGALAWTGAVRQLRRVPDTVIHRAKLAMEERRLAATLAKAPDGLAAPLRERLGQARARLEEALLALHDRREAWETRKREWKARGEAHAQAWRQAKSEWNATMAQQRRELREAWSEWKAARSEARRLAFA